MSLLDRDGCERIHQASLTILSRTGVRVLSAPARKLLADAGAAVAEAEALVKLPAALVDWAVEQAPSSIALYGRGSSDARVLLAGREVSFGSGSDAVNYLDPRVGRRLFTAADQAACVRLCDGLPELSFVMSMGIPSDVPVVEQYRRQFAAMIGNTAKPLVFVANDRSDCEAITAMAAVAAGGIDRLRARPSLLLYSEPTSPLVHTESATDKLLYMARQTLPVVHSPAPMMGGTAPVTLAGGMALGNAEVLSSLVMHQLAHPGAPFVYGTGLHHLDMKTTVTVYGGPEFQLARAMVAELGRFYGLPTWGYSGCSDSLVLDEQAALDAGIQVRDALLLGANLVHDVGYLEAGLMTSPELIVLTAELIAMHCRFDRGVELDDDSLALDVIHEVGPGGNYLASSHTRKHYRRAFFPTLLERRRHGEWARDGCQRLGDRLKAKTLALMAEHQPAPLPPSQAAEIERLVRHPG